MDRLEERLKRLKRENKLGLMTHVIVGYPDLDKTADIIQAMDRSGVDLIELQIPFSDPLADGPTIMRACEVALENGSTVRDAFNLATQLSDKISVPLLFMAYFNTVFKYGVERFCRDAAKAGVCGLIIPDIPVEEDREEGFSEQCSRYKLANIRVISPVSTKERIIKNAKMGTGFVYCTARQGITGTEKGLDIKVIKYLDTVKKNFRIPLALGFGISSKKDVDLVRGHTDIVVLGSAIVELIGSSDKDKIGKNVTEFIKGLGV